MGIKMKQFSEGSSQPDREPERDPFGDPVTENIVWEGGQHVHDWYTLGNGVTLCSVPGCNESKFDPRGRDTGYPPLAAEFPESYRNEHEVPPGVSKGFAVLGFLIVSLFAILLICFLIVGIVKALEIIL